MRTTSAIDHWVCSPVSPVGGNALVPGGYIRNTLTAGTFRIGVSYHASSGWTWAEKSKNWNNQGWVWRNVQAIPDVAGGPPSPTEFSILEGFDYARVCVLAVSDDSSPRTLDLDAISMGTFWK